MSHDKVDYKRLEELKSKGLKPWQIAQRLNIGYGTIHSALKKLRGGACLRKSYDVKVEQENASET